MQAATITAGCSLQAGTSTAASCSLQFGPRAGQETLGGPAAELPTRVILRADKDAPYGAVRTALVAAQERGFAHFSLVVLRSLR